MASVDAALRQEIDEPVASVMNDELERRQDRVGGWSGTAWTPTPAEYQTGA